MHRLELSTSSVRELRDHLRTRIDRIAAAGSDEQIDNADTDLQAILDYFLALPDSEYTPDGADALFQLARNYSYAAKPAKMLQAASLASRMAIAAGDRLWLSRARNKEGIALAELGRLVEQASGSQFDPLLLKTFVELIRSEFWRPMAFDAFLVEGADQHEYVNACLRMEAVVGTEFH